MPVFDQEIMSAISRKVKMETIAESVKEGKCILFLGSGVHYHSEEYNYPKEQRPLLGKELSQQLAGQCEFSTHFPDESKDNLQRVAMCYEIANSREQLIEEVKKAVQVKKAPSPALQALAKLPFPLIVTTNYDNLLEKALLANGKDPKVVVYDQEGKQPVSNPAPTLDEPVVFKIHGDFNNSESIVITDEDYIQFVLRMSGKGDVYPVPESFLYHFQIWPTLFVGYSLLDYNLRLLFKTLRWKVDKANVPQTYSVDPYPDPLIFDVWGLGHKKYVTFITQSVWTFVPDLYKRVTGADIQ